MLHSTQMGCGLLVAIENVCRPFGHARWVVSKRKLKSSPIADAEALANLAQGCAVRANLAGQNWEPRKVSIAGAAFSIHDLRFTIYAPLLVPDGYCIRQILIARNRLTYANPAPSTAIFASRKWHPHCTGASCFSKQVGRMGGCKFTPATLSNVVKKLETMMKNYLTCLLASALLLATISLPAAAQANAQTVEAIKIKIAKLGVGEKAKAKVTLKDGTKSKGYIAQAGDDDFVLRDRKTDAATTTRYTDVARVESNRGHSTARNIGIGVGIGVGAFLAIVAITLAHLD